VQDRIILLFPNSFYIFADNGWLDGLKAMKRYRNILFYIGVTGFFSALMFWVIHLGKKLEIGNNVIDSPSGLKPWTEQSLAAGTTLEHPFLILLAQIVTILIVCRIFGWLFEKINQPTVIGEIMAGIVLGPSLLGYYFPDFSSLLFPTQSLTNLNLVSQIGLILFMFMVGMELDFKLLKTRANDAVIISHASIIVPFALGICLAYFIYEIIAPEGVHFLSFALFIGIALSITAFPVLARIVQERGIHKTRLGVMVITCAAIDDITAWSLLAVVIAIVKAGSIISALPTILFSVAYVILMLQVVRPFLARIGELHTTRENLTKPVVAIFFLVLMLSAFATEIIGIHAIFGGFMAGLIMPENVKFRNVFIEKVEDVAMVLFLPLFFVYTGLRTQIGLLDDPGLWKNCLMIIIVAISGKFLGATFSAKFTRLNWKESLSIGVLMNTRGLVELVVLNIGFDLGVLSPELFAMMVIMALVTTFMTAPALDVTARLFGQKAEIPVKEPFLVEKFNLLLSFGNPERGKSMIRLAHSFVKQIPESSTVTALHLSPVDDMFHPNMDDYENESFAPLIEESQVLKQPVRTIFNISGNIEADIAELANHGDYDMVIVGVGQSIFEGSLLGKMIGFTARFINPAKLFYHVTGKEKLWNTAAFDERIRSILAKTDIPVGIFIDKNLTSARRVLIPVATHNDAFLVNYARMLITNSGSKVTIYDPDDVTLQEGKLKTELASFSPQRHDHLKIHRVPEIGEEFLKNFDLMLVSMENWAHLVENQHKWLFHIPSALILTS